jgi:hypothetical protein
VTKTFLVCVEKKQYLTGHVKVEAKDLDAAIRDVRNQIDNGDLQTTDVTWGDPEYEDDSFDTTGDVDET